MIHTTLGPPPAITRVKQLKLAAAAPQRIGTKARSACEMTVHPAKQLPPGKGTQAAQPKTTPPTRDAGGAAAAPARARREPAPPKTKPIAAKKTARDQGSPPPALPGHAL